MSKHKGILLALLSLTTLTSLLLLTRGATSQEPERVIEALEHTEAPAKIASVKSPKGTLDIGKSFTADDEWFKGLSITVLNSSDKNITHITLGLLFPKPTGSEAVDKPPFYYSIAIGHDPRSVKLSGTDNSIKLLLPGRSSEISLTDKAYDSIKESLRKLNYPQSIKHIKVVIEKIFFDDGTAMVWGTLLPPESE